MLLVEIGLSALEETPEAAGHEVETEPLCWEVLTRPGWSSSVVLTSSAPLAAAAALWSTVVLSGPHLTKITIFEDDQIFLKKYALAVRSYKKLS